MSQPGKVRPTNGDNSPINVAESLRLVLADARDNLADALARVSFRRIDNCEDPGETWLGTLTFRPLSEKELRLRTTAVEIFVPTEFPFATPKVHPGTKVWAEVAFGRAFGDDYYEPSVGWHRDLNLAMCLFIEADHTRLPWADGQALLEHARAWLAHDAAGWPEDESALDLERYLQPSTDSRLVLYGTLDGRDQQVLRLRHDTNGVLRLDGPAAPHRTRKRSSRTRWTNKAILVLDAGELLAPIRNWDDLLAAVGSERADHLTRSQSADLRRSLVTYRRGDMHGVLVLELRPSPNGTVDLRALSSAPDNLATRHIRAHPDVETLADKRIAILGVGAIGSVVADLLHRSGVGTLNLVDHDTVLPGNTTRHLLGDAAVGLPKARAVANALYAARPRLARPEFEVRRLTMLDHARELLSSFDLVIDATADSTATAMLTTAARAGAGQLLSACILADGYAIRVDRIPTHPDQQPLPAPDLLRASPAVYEAGCGSPVSTTPPAAVWEAAAIAARHAIELLLDPNSVPAGEQRVLGQHPAPG
jgi:molybdopterin/thiamine biosynthesis adenylyltransferase